MHGKSLMRTLIDWLRRIEAAEPATLAVSQYRVWVPGLAPLGLTDWLIHCEPQPGPPQPAEGSSPTALSVVRILEIPAFAENVNVRHRLGAELAGLLTLALDRRVELAHEIFIHVPQLGRVIPMPFTQIVDRTVIGPLPNDSRARIESLLVTFSGLGEADLDVLAAALSVYHSAILLFDKDARAAYALLVSGIELLSREYGTPPTSWADWDQAATWDAFLTEVGVSHQQADAVRTRLLEDKQLRLKATFRGYASTRLPSSFWDTPWQQWTYGINANEQRWTDAVPDPVRPLRDLLPEDRAGLSKALGKSYDLRSAFVHQGDWLELFQFTTRAGTPVTLDAALPFSIMRVILAQLIRVEAQARSKPRPLPDIQIASAGDSSAT